MYNRVGFKEMMSDKDIMKSFFGIGFSNIAIIFYCVIFSVLGYVYQTFPGQEKLVGLMVTLPGILACIGGYTSSIFLRKLSAKAVMILSYSVTIIGGLLCFFVGNQSLVIGIIGIAMTGFAAGTIPPARATAWARISTSFMKDKMSWITLFYTFGWMGLNTFAGVMAAQTGKWTMAFTSTFFLIPILVIIIILFPGKKEVERIRAKYNLDAQDASDIGKEQTEVKSYMPKSVIGIIILTFVVCLFYMALNLNASDYIINELGIGTSATVVMTTNIHMVIAIFLYVVLFAIIRKLKGFCSTVGLFLMAGGMLLAALVPALWSYIIGATIVGIGMDIHVNSIYTVCAMAPKGKAVGTANGLINGTIYFGEAMCVYIAPLVAGLLFHATTASAAIKTGGIMCAILAVVIFPFFRSAYKDSFGKDDEMLKKEKAAN